MLVISRKENESITIEPAEGVDPSLTLREVFEQGSIVVTLTHISPRRVRIVIEAPTALRIMRTEIASAGSEAPAGPESGERGTGTGP
jgi:sRNA-binding carbon storage regulator CsrA